MSQTSSISRFTDTCKNLVQNMWQRQKLFGVHCPDCRAKLEKTAYRDIEVYACEICGGYWFDGEANDRILSLWKEKLSKEEWEHFQWTPNTAVGEQLQQASPPQHLCCPRHACRLEHAAFSSDSDLVVVHCSECGGMWVPQEESHKLFP